MSRLTLSRGDSNGEAAISLARKIKLQQMLVFEQVVEAGTIMAAAARLHMTQPAVTKSIRELEAQLGGALFIRGKRGVALTDFGRLFEDHIRIVLAEMRYLSDEVEAWHDGKGGKIIVGTLISASAQLLPEAIAQVRASAPDIVINVRVGSNAILFPALARGEIDVIVGFLPIDPAIEMPNESELRLKLVPLYEESLCVAAARDHPLTGAKRLDREQLEGLDWIVPPPDAVARHAAVRFFERIGMPFPARRVESLSLLTNATLLLRSDMVGLVPRAAAEPFIQAGLLRTLRISTQAPFGTVGYTIRGDRPPTAPTARLLEALRTVGASLAHPPDDRP